MSTKRSNGKIRDDRSKPYKGFNGTIEFRLRTGEKKRVRELAESLVIGDIILKAVDEGLRPAARYDLANDCYRVDLYRCVSGYPDSGYSLTTRHKDLTVAFAHAYFAMWEAWDGRMPVNPDEEYNY